MKIYLKLFLIFLVIGVLGWASYLYFTRTVKAPSQVIINNNPINLQSSGEETRNLFKITADSQAQYNIGEVLSGNPFLVIGLTNQVFGDFILDQENPANTKINKITINARTFKTDNERRDAAVARFILRSEDGDKEFIEFQPQQINNLPVKFESGQSYNLNIMGDLTISGITKQASFNMTAYFEQPGLIKIEGQGTVLYKDFGLAIPELPFLANVDEEVVLKINLTAKK